MQISEEERVGPIVVVVERALYLQASDGVRQTLGCMYMWWCSIPLLARALLSGVMANVTWQR
jgi:hypothetical protein